MVLMEVLHVSINALLRSLTPGRHLVCWAFVLLYQFDAYSTTGRYFFRSAPEPIACRIAFASELLSCLLS